MQARHTQGLNDLVITLERQNQIKKDYLVKPSNMFLENGNLVVTAENQPVIFQPTTLFHSQVSAYADIPKKYYDRTLAANPTLLDSNVNYWLQKMDKPRLVRTFQDESQKTARAFLSDSYSLIDNYEILFETLEALRASGLNAEIFEADVTETKLYLKVVCPEIEIKAPEFLKTYARALEVGTGIVSGFTVSNSEVGKGVFQISPRAHILSCNNGMVYTNESLRRVHLGAKLNEIGFDKNRQVKSANIRLIKEQIKHAVSHFTSHEYLKKIVDHYTEKGSKEIEAPYQNVIQVISDQYQLGEERKNNLLNYFIKGADTRRSGVFQAITEQLQDSADADLRSEGEVMAFEVLNNFDSIEAEAIKTKFSSN